MDGRTNGRTVRLYHAPNFIWGHKNKLCVSFSENAPFNIIVSKISDISKGYKMLVWRFIWLNISLKELYFVEYESHYYNTIHQYSLPHISSHFDTVTRLQLRKSEQNSFHNNFLIYQPNPIIGFG